MSGDEASENKSFSAFNRGERKQVSLQAEWMGCDFSEEAYWHILGSPMLNPLNFVTTYD